MRSTAPESPVLKEPHPNRFAHPPVRCSPTCSDRAAPGTRPFGRSPEITIKSNRFEFEKKQVAPGEITASDHRMDMGYRRPPFRLRAGVQSTKPVRKRSRWLRTPDPFFKPRSVSPRFQPSCLRPKIQYRSGRGLQTPKLLSSTPDWFSATRRRLKSSRLYNRGRRSMK